YMRIDSEIEADGPDPLQIGRVLQQAVRQVFPLADFEALDPYEGREVEVAFAVKMVCGLPVPALERPRRRKSRGIGEDGCVDSVRVAEPARGVKSLQVETTGGVLGVHVPQRESCADALERRIGLAVLPGVARKHATSYQQPGPLVVECRVH